MKDLLENENGVLDQGYFSPEQIEMRNIASGLTERPPMVPTNDLENRVMSRTMNVVPPQQQMGSPPAEAGAPPPGETAYQSYESPWQALRNQKQNALAERMQYQQGELDKKLSNPFFKVTDFVADVARNTIGLPMNMLTGGTGFTYDPSNDARTKTRNRLENLEDLQFSNNELYQTGVESRATAMEDMVNKQRTSETNAMNATSAANPFNKVNPANFTPESLAQFDATVRAGLPDYGVLKPVTKTIVKKDEISGRMGLYQLNVDGTEESFIGFVDEFGEGLDDKDRVNKFEDWNKAADSWLESSDQAMLAASTRETRQLTMEAQIKLVRELAPKAAGAASVLNFVPGSDYKAYTLALETLKGIIGFEELRAIKKSGATLGQVAVMELQALQGILGSLDPALAEDRILKVINRIEATAARMEKGIVDNNANQIARYGTRDNRAANPYGSALDQNNSSNGSETTNSLNLMDD